MVSKRYDRRGNLTGFTRSAAEERRLTNETFGLLLVLAIIAGILAPFVPLLLASLFSYYYLIGKMHWHPLFAGALASLPTLGGLWLLYRFRFLRALFFGTETAVGAYFFFQHLQTKTDFVWSCAGTAVFVLLFGWSTILLTRA